jgi:hypothetical protein
MYSVLADELSEDDDTTEQQVPQHSDVSEKSLWVDKYSPKSYVELLSDDVSWILVQNHFSSQLPHPFTAPHTYPTCLGHPPIPFDFFPH